MLLVPKKSLFWSTTVLTADIMDYVTAGLGQLTDNDLLLLEPENHHRLEMTQANYLKVTVQDAQDVHFHTLLSTDVSDQALEQSE